MIDRKLLLSNYMFGSTNVINIGIGNCVLSLFIPLLRAMFPCFGNNKQKLPLKF